VRRHGRPVIVVTTVRWHRRSRDEVLRRLGATHVRRRAGFPAGVEALPIRRAGETMVWLPGPRALIPGDRLLGDGQGGLRLCPESWLEYLEPGLTLAELRDEVRGLIDLPVELVLVSHGEPVVAEGRAALERALS
jgi:glyoxylase-like metal-dependent hydrolase (beta-lactamase superfamily II)